MVPRETGNNAYANFGGANKEYYGVLILANELQSSKFL